MSQNLRESTAKSFELPTPGVGEEYLDFVRNLPATGVKVEEDSHPFLAADDKMLRIKDVVQQIARTNAPILITGESGTGKEVVARAIHQASDRAERGFVAINCAALPATLLESELFGYERGAFTGANQRHIGKFEVADGGTLLLDEVTETEKGIQAKLLRALQEKEVERLGGNGPIRIDARIIATTNRDVGALVAEGLFRQDLYYRLYVIHLEIPPLRHRPKDIEVLAAHFVEKYSRQYGRLGTQLSRPALTKLLMHSWPGNIRELQNVLQRAVIMCRGQLLTPDDLPLETVATTDQVSWTKQLPIGKTLYDVETHLIIETLRHHLGNRTHAARTLGMSLRNLRNKINEFTSHGLDVPKPAGGRLE